MNIKKYLNKMTDYLDVDKRKYSSRTACIQQVLKELKKRKHELKAQLKTETRAKKCESLKTELSVVQAQRKKGIKALTALKKEHKES